MDPCGTPHCMSRMEDFKFLSRSTYIGKLFINYSTICLLCREYHNGKAKAAVFEQYAIRMELYQTNVLWTIFVIWLIG